MFGSRVLDTILALVAIYATLSLVCSVLGEWASAGLRWRPKVLVACIREMLAGPDHLGRGLAKVFFEAPLIRALSPPQDDPTREPRGPSYLPAHTFAETVLQLIKPPDWNGSEPLTFNDYARIVEELPNSDVKATLQTVARASNYEIGQVREHLGAWYLSAMARASGWYKRKMWGATLGIATLLCVGLGLDLFAVASLVSPPKPTQPYRADPATDQPPDGSRYLLPTWAIGSVWEIGPPDTPPSPYLCLASRIVGILLSILLVTAGAPLWFDCLNRLANNRLCGPKPGSPE